MLLELFVTFGVLFGLLAAACASLIVYREYRRHVLSKRQLWRISASAGLFALLAFIVLAVAAGYAFSHLTN